METPEIVVYLVITVIIGGLIIGFIAGMNTTQMYDAVRNVFVSEDRVSFDSVSSGEFSRAVFNFWESCNHGLMSDELVLSLEGESSVSKESLFNSFKRLNLCYTIQSEGYDCGSREDVSFDEEIEPPAIIRLTCNNETKMLEINEIE